MMPTNNDKTLGALAYVFFLIPLLISKERSPFLTFHLNQGLNVFITVIVFYILAAILGGIGGFYWILRLLNICIWILAIVGIVQASQGKTTPLPVIGNMLNLIK
jgi:uncharacterized membrane protein